MQRLPSRLLLCVRYPLKFTSLTGCGLASTRASQLYRLRFRPLPSVRKLFVPSTFSASATEPSPLLSAAVSASARASPPLHYILRAACRLVSRRTKARGLSISANAVTTSADALLNASKRNATMVRQRMRGSTTSVSKWTSWTTRYHDVFCVMPIMRQWLIELRHHNTYFCWFVAAPHLSFGASTMSCLVLGRMEDHDEGAKKG